MVYKYFDILVHGTCFGVRVTKTVHAKIFYLIHDNLYFFFLVFKLSIVIICMHIAGVSKSDVFLTVRRFQSCMGVCVCYCPTFVTGYCPTFVITVRHLLLATVRHLLLLSDTCYWLYCPTFVTGYCPTFVITVRHLLLLSDICYYCQTFAITVRRF